MPMNAIYPVAACHVLAFSPLALTRYGLSWFPVFSLFLPVFFLSGLGRMEPGINLYSRKVMIQAKTAVILPDWLRFIRGATILSYPRPKLLHIIYPSARIMVDGLYLTSCLFFFVIRFLLPNCLE